MGNCCDGVWAQAPWGYALGLSLSRLNSFRKLRPLCLPAVVSTLGIGCEPPPPPGEEFLDSNNKNNNNSNNNNSKLKKNITSYESVQISGSE